jgi:hypothetical protein
MKQNHNFIDMRVNLEIYISGHNNTIYMYSLTGGMIALKLFVQLKGPRKKPPSRYRKCHQFIIIIQENLTDIVELSGRQPKE